jgi:hypothetical protein
MPDPTGAERSRRYRERQAGRLPPTQRPACEACGITHTGAHGLLCSRCWERLTSEGRAAKAERVRKSRARQRNATKKGPITAPSISITVSPSLQPFTLPCASELTICQGFMGLVQFTKSNA